MYVHVCSYLSVCTYSEANSIHCVCMLPGMPFHAKSFDIHISQINEMLIIFNIIVEILNIMFDVINYRNNTAAK